MQTTYAQKNETTQRAADNTAAAVHDNSPQSECLQRHASLANAAVQRAENPPRPNNTGLPDDLKNGIESLSGYSLDNVRVHYNSPKPATVQALAYTQGTDIHVAPGQEHALPHEAWHVTQQMAGRVSPTTNIGGMPVNDNAALEHEADVMGEKAVQCKRVGNVDDAKRQKNGLSKCCTLQRIVIKGCPIKSSGSKGRGSFSFNAEKMRLLIFYKKMVDSGIIKITEIGSETSLPAAWYKEENWENFKKYLDLDIKDYQSFQDILNKIADVEGLLNDATKKDRIRKLAFAESHEQKTYDNYNDKQEKQNFESFFEKEFLKNVLIYSNDADVIHQIAQDYLLSCTEYSDLQGQPHTFSTFSYKINLSQKKFGTMKDVQNGNKNCLRYTPFVIYRTFKLASIAKNCSEGIEGNSYKINVWGGGHGGALGTALYYAESQNQGVGCDDVAIIKIIIPEINMESWHISNSGEGLDAKTEKSTALPLEGGQLNGKDYSADQFSLSFNDKQNLYKALDHSRVVYELVYYRIESERTYTLIAGDKSKKIEKTSSKLGTFE